MKEKQGWVSVDDRLPEYEREVVVLVSTGMAELGEFKVAYGHRPNPNGYVITKTGEHIYAKLYDAGGWNGPDIKYWLDLPMPNEQRDDTKTMRTMTNEEKALEIARLKSISEFDKYENPFKREIYDRCMEMAEWKDKQLIDSLPEEPASEDLEKATRHYLLNKHVSPLNDIMHQIDLKAEMQYHKDVENAFKEGVEWQKQQMMKDAVECTWGSRATSSLMNNFPNIKCDDKVKIIIVKEE